MAFRDKIERLFVANLNLSSLDNNITQGSVGEYVDPEWLWLNFYNVTS